LKLKPEQQADTPSKLKRKVNNELSPQQEIDKSPSKKSRIETNSELSSLYYLLEKVVSIDPTSKPVVNNIDTFDDQKCRNIVWVMKWIDYSAKFGLGYTLCNNSSGVVFNDNSKIVMSNEGRIDYFEPVDGNNRKNEMKSFLNVTNLAELINNTADKFIHKRLVLLQNFHTYLDSCKPSNGLDTQVNLICDNPIYIRHWLRTENSILFYLSNSTIQINFFDHSKILLSDCHSSINSENNNVILTFVKDGIRRTNFLSYAVSSPQHAQESMGVSLDDLLSRLRYLKDCTRLID
jgi:polo-like kinase 1